MKTRWYLVSALILLVCGLAFLTAGRGPVAAASAQAAYQQSQSSGTQENSLDHPYTLKDPGPWGAAKAQVHVPSIVYEKTTAGLKVTVQVDHHPMDAQTPHYIMWIKLRDGKGADLGEKTFVATDPSPATATFNLTSIPAALKAYEQCNVHGIWMSEVKVEIK